MNLLIITRKVDENDSRVGFFNAWLYEFSKRTETLHVIAWQESASKELPRDNIKLIALRGGVVTKIFLLQKHLFFLLRKVDGIFCHMNPEYVILCAPLSKLFRKKLVCWYTHRAISIRRKLMEVFANTIMTASKESFREPLYKTKVKIIGHGVDLRYFTYSKKVLSKNKLTLLTVGRISPTKDIETMILGLSILLKSGVVARFNIVGEPALASDRVYLNNLKMMVEKLSLKQHVLFPGARAHYLMPQEYKTADVFINLSGTESIDKAVLEAMASGCFVLTSNEAFADVLAKRWMLTRNNPENLSEKIKEFIITPDEEIVNETERLRQFVEQEHNLENTVQKIISAFK